MRAPDGVEHWTRGIFSEIAPPSRLVLDLKVSDAAGRFLFRALTEVSFFGEKGATRMDVVQTYAFEDPAQAGPMVKGAPVGCAETLDKLQAELVRMQQPEADDRSVVHATFTLERTYDAPVAKVFEALSDVIAKSKWFAGDSQWQVVERNMDFRVGGREVLEGRWEGGAQTKFDAIYFDIAPNERILYAYDMYQNGRKLSVSLATMQLTPAGPGQAPAARASPSPNRAHSSTATTMRARASTARRYCSTGWARRCATEGAPA